MMLFGADGLIKKYETPQDVLVEFFAMRLQFYQKRHAFLIAVSKCQYLDCSGHRSKAQNHSMTLSM